MIEGREAAIVIERLEIENVALRIRLRSCEKELRGKRINFPAQWGLTRQEAILLGMLMTRELVSKTSLWLALPKRWASEENTNYVSMLLSRVRKKLSPLGITIHCAWNIGYSIAPEHKQILRNEIEAER